ncbi:YHYH protein [Zooshikella harenae]|uniref:YHYH protein n=1 Tax=Zooshikella harenae TaxID=2827238 RepID=A0ABS5Z7M8_9GAMM|nr:YHYH protein [Zooshikella harenae]MBU2710009.1 YHYH protein [Zooshikella harenae]
MSPSDFKYFSSPISFGFKDCNLETNKIATCIELVFISNPLPEGPYCPKSVDQTGGIYDYDGVSNPGLQPINHKLLMAMETDGFDIVDDRGKVRIAHPNDVVNQRNRTKKYCLEADPDYKLKLKYLIPANPTLRKEPSPIDNVLSLVGVSLYGVPINGPAPSIVNGPKMPDGSKGPVGDLPAVDPCGGHQDPSGFYHFHMFPETINNVLLTHNIHDVRCLYVPQTVNTLIGFAMDGYPIYAHLDINGQEPLDLDQCRGHVGITKDFPFKVYHYHASNAESPNTLPCLRGVRADNPLSLE